MTSLTAAVIAFVGYSLNQDSLSSTDNFHILGDLGCGLTFVKNAANNCCAVVELLVLVPATDAKYIRETQY